MATNQQKPKKTRPQNPGELIRAMSDGSLDGRTAHALNIRAARSVIDAEPRAAARALVADALATWAVCQSAVLAEVSRLKSLMVGGELAPIFGELERVQNNVLKLTNALGNMDDAENKAKPGKGGKTTLDISTLLPDEATP